MSISFDWHAWLDIVLKYPVILVLAGGLTGGIGLTQSIKLWFMAIGKQLPIPVYRALANLTATVITFALTFTFWDLFIPATGDGLIIVVSIIAAALAPWLYKGAKAAVAWKWPAFAARWGDGS